MPSNCPRAILDMQFFSTITASKGSFQKHPKYWREGAVRFDQNWEMAIVNYKNG